MNAILPNGSPEDATAESRMSKSGIALDLLLVGTLLVGFSMGRCVVPLAAWIGPVLIIRYARDHKIGRGFPLIFAANVVSFLIGFVQIWVYWGLTLIPLFAVLYGLLRSLPYLADRLMSARLKGFSNSLTYPLAATNLEFLNNQFNPIGAWGRDRFQLRN